MRFMGVSLECANLLARGYFYQSGDKSPALQGDAHFKLPNGFHD
jgi:hypothetical protein